MGRRWFCALSALLLLFSTDLRFARADADNPMGYDVYVTAPHVASEDITVTLGDKQYLKYDVSISNFDHLLSDNILGGLGTLCVYLFWDYDRLPLLFDNAAAGEQTAYYHTVDPLTDTVKKRYIDPFGTNLKCQMPVVESRRGFDTGYAHLMSTADFVHYDNDLAFSLYFAVPDAPDGTVFYFDFCDIKWDANNPYYNDACLIELFEGGTWEQLDITFGAYNGSITIGDTSLSETTAAPTVAPAQNTDPTERPRVTDAPAATLSPCERNGHSYGAYETVTPATCSVAGDSVAVCTVCGDRQHVALPTDPNAHRAVEDPAIPATCTESGRTNGSHCADCGALLTRQAVTSPLGHDWRDGIVTDETASYTCSRCKLTKTEPITEESKLFSVEYWTEDTLLHRDTVLEGARLFTLPDIPKRDDHLGRWLPDLTDVPIIADTVVTAVYTRFGDVNEDSLIDGADALLALDGMTGVRQLSMHQLRLADLDGNGTLYAWEIALLLRKGVS